MSLSERAGIIAPFKLRAATGTHAGFHTALEGAVRVECEAEIGIRERLAVGVGKARKPCRPVGPACCIRPYSGSPSDHLLCRRARWSPRYWRRLQGRKQMKRYLRGTAKGYAPQPAVSQITRQCRKRLARVGETGSLRRHPVHRRKPVRNPWATKSRRVYRTRVVRVTQRLVPVPKFTFLSHKNCLVSLLSGLLNQRYRAAKNGPANALGDASGIGLWAQAGPDSERSFDRSGCPDVA